MTTYIIPGLGESCSSFRYKKLASDLRKRGHKVKPINPDWHKPISKQLFKVEKDDIIIGFSIGAVLAYLIATKYKCKKVILASISPIHNFKFKESVGYLTSYMGKENAIAIVTDWKNIKISLSKMKAPFITMVGEYETKMNKAEIIVPKAKHYIGREYREEILKMVG